MLAGTGSASLSDCDQQKQATNAANDLYGNGKSVKTKELLRAVNSIPAQSHRDSDEAIYNVWRVM